MRLHRRIGLGALLVFVAAAAIALLRHPSSELASAVTTGAATHAEPARSAPTEVGMMAYIDPETGDLTTGPAPAGQLDLDPELQNALRHDDAGLQVETRADGTKVLNLQGRYQHASIIHIDENGTKTVCTDNVTSAEHNLNHAPVSTPNAPEVK